MLCCTLVPACIPRTQQLALGPLASYPAADVRPLCHPQKEVEQYYISLGVFIPAYHKFYWMGLRTYGWPEFRWLDNSALQGGYSNWGMYYPDYVPEPNNMRGYEYCAGANATTMSNGAFGWSDEQCTVQAPSMCKIAGEQGLQPGGTRSSTGAWAGQVPCMRSRPPAAVGMPCRVRCQCMLLPALRNAAEPRSTRCIQAWAEAVRGCQA
jgi:hypothetical protein